MAEDTSAREGAGRSRAGLRRLARGLPVAALLFAPASVLALMATNLNQTSFADVAPSLAGTLAFAVLVWLAALLVLRCADAAAVVAAVWVVGCLFYQGLFGGLNAALDGGYPMIRSLPFALAALVAVTLVVARLPSALLGAVHTVLGAVAIALLAPPLWQAAAFEWRHGDARNAYDAGLAEAQMLQMAGPEPSAPARRPPDIYHFVFDRYGSDDTLRGYGADASIEDFLEAQGFSVARESHSNYLKTGHSLASTFHMDYLDLLANDPRVTGANWHPIFAMLDDHRVGRFLSARGYRRVQFGAWWAGTDFASTADENRPHGFGEFAMLHLRRTMLRPAFHLLPDAGPTGRLDWDNAQCQRVARQVEEIEAIGEGPAPVHVFAHILVPHGPYVFAPDGSCLSQKEAARRGGEAGYVDQVAYANRIIRDVVTTLLSEDRAPPVIIIQADEGPFPRRDYAVPWQDAPAEELRIKTGILNAVHIPGGSDGALRPDTSPVNLYRTVFNALFGTRFPALPDRVIAFPKDATLYEFHDVTERVRRDPAAEAPAAAGTPSSPLRTR